MLILNVVQKKNCNSLYGMVGAVAGLRYRLLSNMSRVRRPHEKKMCHNIIQSLDLLCMWKYMFINTLTTQCNVKQWLKKEKRISVLYLEMCYRVCVQSYHVWVPLGAALVVRATYLVCHRLISSWKGDLQVSLAALELLSGLAKLHSSKPGQLDFCTLYLWYMYV